MQYPLQCTFFCGPLSGLHYAPDVCNQTHNIALCKNFVTYTFWSLPNTCTYMYVCAHHMDNTRLRNTCGSTRTSIPTCTCIIIHVPQFLPIFHFYSLQVALEMQELRYSLSALLGNRHPAFRYTTKTWPVSAPAPKPAHSLRVNCCKGCVVSGIN